MESGAFLITGPGFLCTIGVGGAGKA